MLLYIVQEANVQDVNDAVEAANAAFPAWRDLGVEKRGEYLRKLSTLLLEANDDLSKLETLSTGRPKSVYPDVGVAAEVFRYFAESGWNVQGTASTNTPGIFKMTLKEPYGVVGLIIPWNFPIINFASKIAPALAAGNTVVLKSSEKAPLTVSYCFLCSESTLLGLALTESHLVTVCCQVDSKGRFPPRRYQHSLWLRQPSRSSTCRAHVGSLHQLHRVVSDGPEDPRGSSKV